MRALIYDAMMVRLTAAWYKAVLERLRVGARVLDVGIGTGSALLKNRELVVERDLRIVGLDINQHYVEKCRNNIGHQLQELVERQSHWQWERRCRCRRRGRIKRPYGWGVESWANQSLPCRVGRRGRQYLFSAASVADPRYASLPAAPWTTPNC
ncbi:MAG: hypothetical protein IH936_13250 [Acidobacteria bacterium]|nr:hypothetical protein [Acidobacteriota bacterium]